MFACHYDLCFNIHYANVLPLFFANFRSALIYIIVGDLVITRGNCNRLNNQSKPVKEVMAKKEEILNEYDQLSEEVRPEMPRWVRSNSLLINDEEFKNRLNGEGWFEHTISTDATYDDFLEAIGVLWNN